MQTRLGSIFFSGAMRRQMGYQFRIGTQIGNEQLILGLPLNLGGAIAGTFQRFLVVLTVLGRVIAASLSEKVGEVSYTDEDRLFASGVAMQEQRYRVAAQCKLEHAIL